MADTPNNDIEKRLRDYAQQRRDAAGTPEMHPATRAMLQAEVKQKLGAAGATPTPRAGWLRIWPRLAFTLGVIALMGVAAILLVPRGEKPKDNFALAKLEAGKPATSFADKSDAAPVLAPAAAAEPMILAGTAASAPPASLDTAATRENLRSRTETPARTEPAKVFKGGAGRDLAKTAARSSTVDVSTNAMPSVGQGFFIASQDRTKESPVVPGSSRTAAKTASSTIQTDALIATAAAEKDFKTTTRLAGKKAEGGELLFDAANAKLGANGQRYRNIVVAEKQKQAAPAVLDEFTVAQDGETLTVIDRDGSVYNGYARIAPPERQGYNANVESANPVQLVPNTGAGGRAGAALEQRGMNRANQLNQAPAQSEASQRFPFGSAAQVQNAVMPLNFVFRVEGTNRSLNERVVFTGNLLQNTGNYYNNASAAQSSANALNYQQQVAPTGNVTFNNSAQNAPVFNNVISGHVQLGNQKPGELNALSVGQ
jgi:hypothetical protein